VHIATHGQFSSRAEDTFILAWDDRINVADLDETLQANALNQAGAIELLVLSACETAVGDQRAALGIAGVAVRAGARSTLATLWSINDQATTEFSHFFYQQLAQPTATRANALRQAQLSLLNDPQYRHPLYWAPYILVGNWL
jgi:CHAT domain-containing protein